MQFEADYFDGISPRAQRVLVSIMDKSLSFSPLTADVHSAWAQRPTFAMADCQLQPRLGQGKRLIDLPDGSRLETELQEIEQHLPKKSAQLFWRAVHYAESHLWLVMIALLGIVLASLLLLKYGVPLAARLAAVTIPASMEQDLGRQTLATLDYQKLGYFKASALTEARKSAIQDALTKACLKTKDCPSYQLEFRKSPVLGANAFALPGGYVVITDELIALANNKSEQDKNPNNTNEVIAVLLHELGHVKGRHALRQTLQGTLSGIIVIAITGDVSSIAAGLPTVMLNMNYSRHLEAEADRYALNSLKTACIPTLSFAKLLLKLENSHRGAHVPEMISSHPDTKQRIKPFLIQHNCQS